MDISDSSPLQHLFWHFATAPFFFHWHFRVKYDMYKLQKYIQLKKTLSVLKLEEN